MTEKPLGSKDIRLIEDQPIGGGDGTELLGLEPFARVMARVALGTTGPFTIGVYAGWGQGKTSLLKRTRHLVEAEGRLDTVAVWFNAWQYEREEHPLFPLIAAIADAVQGKRKVASFFDDLHTCLNGLLTGLKLSAKPFGVGGELDVGKAIEADEELRDSVLKRETVCMEEFRRLERTTENSKGEVKVIVFIDDLDRCLPDKALALLESIKLVLNQPGFIFLLALDYRIVVSFLAKEYREKYGITDETEAERIAATYLDKIVQWQLDVPHHAPRFRDFLRGLAGREDLKGTRVSEIIRILAPDDPDSEEDAPPSLLALGADYNPRSLVRLLNSLLVDSALWEAMHEGQAEPKPDEKDVLVCMTVTHVLRQPQHLGHARARALAMSDRLCEALLVETSGARDETPATMAEGRGRSPDDDALERIVRADKQVYELLTGQGRVWLENHELRKSVYDFVERQRPVPEDQQAIFERAVRNAVGLEPDAPIPPERLRDLATLDFTGESDFGDAGLRLVAGVPGLQELRLNGTQVSDQGLQHLANLTSLQGLHLRNTQISDQGLQHLANLTSLQGLDLRNTQISDQGLQHLANLTSLQGLYLFGTQVSDQGLQRLEKLTSLQGLYLNGTQVSDQGLQHLANLTSLKMLFLFGTQVSDQGLPHLANLTSLRVLGLMSTQVSDQGLQHLANLSSLQALDLSGTQVSDQGLQHLANLTGLQGLYLTGTQVSDQGLQHLQNLTCLQTLDLSNTQVSDEGVKALQAALPQCQIIR